MRLSDSPRLMASEAARVVSPRSAHLLPCPFGPASTGGGRDRMAAMGSPPVPGTAGTSVLDLLKSYEEIVGPDVLAAAREKLPAEIRAELDAMTSLSWMP